VCGCIAVEGWESAIVSNKINNNVIPGALPASEEEEASAPESVGTGGKDCP